MTWPCEAYGEEGMEHGALCFIASELHTRFCISQQACHEIVQTERRRVFDRIHEQAQAGDPVAQMLAEEFTSPDQLLGGDAGEPDA